MNEVTATGTDKRHCKQVDTLLNGEPSLNMQAEATLKEVLQAGQQISDERSGEPAKSKNYQRCLNAAVHYLRYRPRSEFEVRERLQRRGFNRDNIEAVIARLKEQGLIDDLAFAKFWMDNRDSFNPRSQRSIKLELKQKGVAGNIIDQVDITDDTISAYRAAQGKVRNLPMTDYRVFHRRLGEYLRRRGFGYEIINNIVEQVWQEQMNIPE
ncbi:regulatory protein RecX [Chloroflexota bacterium]